MRRLRDEIDEVIGMSQPQYEHLSNLPYLTGEIDAFLHEKSAEK